MIRLKTVEGTTPKMLLDAIYEGIAKKEGEKGKIATWEKDADGYLRHTTSPDNQWRNLGWLKPSMPESIKSELRFTFDFPRGEAKKMVFKKADLLDENAGIKVKPKPSTQIVYAIYHGRFLEMLMSHFSDLFTITEVTPKLPAAKPKAD
jgi:hypothetical protein